MLYLLYIVGSLMLLPLVCIMAFLVFVLPWLVFFETVVPAMRELWRDMRGALRRMRSK